MHVIQLLEPQLLQPMRADLQCRSVRPFEEGAHGRPVKLVARPEPPALNRRRVAVRRPAPRAEADRVVQLPCLGHLLLGIHFRVEIGVVVILPAGRRHGDFGVEVRMHVIQLLEPQLLEPMRADLQCRSVRSFADRAVQLHFGLEVGMHVVKQHARLMGKAGKASHGEHHACRRRCKRLRKPPLHVPSQN